MKECPICFKEHNTELFKCSCGYQRLKKYDDNDYLFEIYKFTKAIFQRTIEWENSKLDINEDDEKIIIYEVLENDFSISKVELNTSKYIITDQGILPFNLKVKSLIINVDEVDSMLLDESNIRILFIGDKLKKIVNDSFYLCSPVKYIEVDKNNQYFSSNNNVLFNKNQTILLNYARMKKEEEYYVPETVKKIDANAFMHCDYLKRIYVSKKVDFRGINAVKKKIEIKYLN